jgi:hypothetical protein
MSKIHALADRFLTLFAPEASAAAHCGVYYICDGGPKIRCERQCDGSEDVCVLVGGWCW